jgi:chromosomal replication initiator protein
MYSNAYIWAKVVGLLEERLTSTLISTWLDDAELVDLTDTQLVLYSPSEYRKDIIERRLSRHICDTLKELFDRDVSLVVLGDDEMAEYRAKKETSVPYLLNPQFTFDTFVVGQSNSFAHAAAYSVALNPAGSYNPLFIYGQSGLGKTHLLYAIANYIHETRPKDKIVYIKGDQFTNELISAVQAGKNIEFRDKYRSADLFLMDDIQFIAGKDSTQEEFFHTFNNLYENHKQIVLTSDRPPGEMLRLEDRLRTRFEWGLICDVKAPEYETRVAITRSKALAMGVDLPDDVCSYIAENITNNIRQLEGTVKKIKAYHDLQNMPLDVANVSRAIKDMYKGNAEALPTPSLIIAEVCRFYSIEERVLRGTLKNKSTAEARHVAMYLIRKLTNLSFPDIGKEFGKDHTSVIHAIKKVESLIDDPTSGIQDNLRDITANINSKL